MTPHGSTAVQGERYIVSHTGLLLETGQTAIYHVMGDGDLENGLDKSHEARATAGTTNVDVPHYAANTISFTAPSTVSDTANGLATILTGDTVTIRGSTSNDGVYTVAGGGVAGSFTVNEVTIQTEAAGDYVSICKRAAMSNQTVYDQVTGLLWLRNTTTGLKWGVASDGNLVWDDAAAHFTLHGAAADLAIVVPNILRIVGGAAEVGFYHAGDALVCSGFANGVNNLTGYRVTLVAVNGADLDITLDPSNNTLIAEAAGGARDIKLCCQSAFAYAAAATQARLADYGDWRVPNITEARSILDYSLNPVTPDVVAFPSWPNGLWWTSTTDPSVTANALSALAGSGVFASLVKTSTRLVPLVRLG